MPDLEQQLALNFGASDKLQSTTSEDRYTVRCSFTRYQCNVSLASVEQAV